VTAQKSSVAAIAVNFVIAVIWGMGGKVENYAKNCRQFHRNTKLPVQYQFRHLAIPERHGQEQHLKKSFYLSTVEKQENLTVEKNRKF
jgi:hypothetical protein